MSAPFPPWMKRLVSAAVPAGLYSRASALHTALVDRDADPRIRESITRLWSLKNAHRGGRCFIIGNGPSLRTMDLTPLQSEFCFGCNRIYLLFDEKAFQTTYYVCVNPLVLEQFADDIRQISCTKFISTSGMNLVGDDPNTIFISTRRGPGFYRYAPYGLWEGATVTYVAM
ncbi:MAG: hypothetical protein GF418_15495, partial [Chitinivibrionales bacterium]|nr:hypothetical protein [Chitinivibrionales bacterium]MBD3397025.1 hypothetical protein [Chitinivibrionales bacterium]